MPQWPDWIYRQSAALPYRGRGDDLEVLLVTSRGGHRWVAPKGIVEPGMTAPESAAKEAFEEAGVRGEISERELGRYRQRKWGGLCEVEVFPMRVTTELPAWPEAGIRQREWLPISQAVKRIDKKDLRKIVQRLPEALAEQPEGDARAAEPGPSSVRLIYLFRHAKSSWDDPSLEDFDRPLAPRGQRAVETMQSYMALADVRPDLVLCSASQRTRATLEGVRRVIGEAVSVTCDRELYHAGPRGLLARLCGLPDEVTSVMMIGHNPGLQSLGIALSGRGGEDVMVRMRSKFPTAGLATLVFRGKSWSGLAPGACELHSFVVPRDLE
jgi:phosphohistidine phosphatase